MESVVPFIAAGLEDGEFCLWMVNETMDVTQATEALGRRIKAFEKYMRASQIALVPARDWYLGDGSVDSRKLVSKMRSRMRDAMKSGWHGVRGVGGVHNIDHRHWDSWLDYEDRVGQVLIKERSIALCTYSLPNCPLANISKVIGAHEKTFLKKGWHWEVVDKT